jgi:hypothetical protein
MIRNHDTNNVYTYNSGPYTSYERETLDAAMIYAYRDESGQ